jgi:Protein of unknown function (DUF2441)
MPKKTGDESFYYFASLRLGPGSVIFPGNWGRMLRRYENDTSIPGNLFGSAWVLARELRFEVVRLKEFSDKPSRLECAFCCLSIDEARAYQNSGADRPKVLLLHRVELVDPTLPRHVAAIDYVKWPPPNSSFLDVSEQLAKQYWIGHVPEGAARELLTLSQLRVVENID